MSGKRQLQMGAGQAQDEQSSSRLLCLSHHGVEVSQCALLSKGPVLPCLTKPKSCFPGSPMGGLKPQAASGCCAGPSPWSKQAEGWQCGAGLWEHVVLWHVGLQELLLEL